MNNAFKENPSSSVSTSRRRKVYGVGINDAQYDVSHYIDGKQSICPFYSKWKGMIARCYSLKVQDARPTYKGCSVCSEWMIFSKFKSWMIRQDWEGMELDKDIIKPGNKVYSPETCRFITRKLNVLLTNRAAKRGRHPQGVSFCKATEKYMAQVNVNGVVKNLGHYDTPDHASSVYVKAKTTLILKAADEHDDPLISNGLRLHAELLNKGNKL